MKNVIFMILVLAFIAGCAPVSSPVADQKRAISTISTQQLVSLFDAEYGSDPLVKNRIDRNLQFTMIDTRSLGDFMEGSIPGSLHIPPQSFERQIPNLPQSRRLIFYSDGSESARRAADIAHAQELNASIWNSPLSGWQSAGKYQTVTIGAIKHRSDTPNPTAFMLIDARSEGDFTAGTISGAVSIPFVDDRQFRALLPVNKSLPLYIFSAGVDCPLSHQAATVAKKAGHTSVHVFSGGFLAWKRAGF